VVVAHGVSVSSTHGRRGPAMIHCETSTRFEARKIVELIGDSVITHPVSVQAETESVRTSVASQWHVGRRVVRAVAERKIRQGRDEIAEASRRRAENRVVAVVDRVVERLRGRAEAYLSRHGSTWTWVSWGDRPAPLKLETDDGFLRLHYQPGPSRMENPLFVSWGQHGRGLRLWVDRRLFRVESDYLQAQMRDGWRVAALAALMLPESDVSASWMAEILDSPPALRVVVPSIELVVSVPAPRDSVTSWLAAAARAWRAGVRLNRETEPQ